MSIRSMNFESDISPPELQPMARSIISAIGISVAKIPWRISKFSSGITARSQPPSTLGTREAHVNGLIRTVSGSADRQRGHSERE